MGKVRSSPAPERDMFRAGPPVESLALEVLHIAVDKFGIAPSGAPAFGLPSRLKPGGGGLIYPEDPGLLSTLWQAKGTLPPRGRYDHFFGGRAAGPAWMSSFPRSARMQKDLNILKPTETGTWPRQVILKEGPNVWRAYMLGSLGTNFALLRGSLSGNC